MWSFPVASARSRVATLSLVLHLGLTSASVPCASNFRPEAVALLMRLTSGDTPLSDLWGGVACSAMLAIEHANRGNGSIVPELAGARTEPALEPLLYNTRSEPATGVRVYREARAAGAVAVVGPARSAVSQPLAYLGAEDSVPLVSHWSSSPDLSDQSLYPTFHRTFASDADSAAAIVTILKHFDWGHFSLLHVADLYAYGYAQKIGERATECGMQVDTTAIFAYGDRVSAAQAVRKLAPQPGQPGQETPVRANIIVLIAFENDLPAIFETAEEIGLLDAPHVWITTDAIQPTDVNTHLQAGRLTARVHRKLVGLSQIYISPESLPGFARYSAAWRAMAPEDCARLAPELLGGLGAVVFDDPDPIGAYAFDAAAAVALASRAITANHTDPAIHAQRLTAALRGLSFSGASGDVAFKSGLGDRDPNGLELGMYNWVLDANGLIVRHRVLRVSVGEALRSRNCSARPTPVGEITWSDGRVTQPVPAFAIPDVIQLAEAEALAAFEAAQRKADDEANRGRLVITIAVPSFVLVSCLLVLCLRRRYQIVALRKRLVLRSTGQPPALSLPEGHRYHLFLSHTWSTAQDQVHLIKRRLGVLMPAMVVFLDVDDLDDVADLEQEVAASTVILLFLSQGYFTSRACQTEYETACRLQKPIVSVHEVDRAHGGSPLAELKATCPTPLQPYIFGQLVVPWVRSTSETFQLVVFKKIVATVLKNCPPVDADASLARLSRRINKGSVSNCSTAHRPPAASAESAASEEPASAASEKPASAASAATSATLANPIEVACEVQGGNESSRSKGSVARRRPSCPFAPSSHGRKARAKESDLYLRKQIELVSSLTTPTTLVYSDRNPGAAAIATELSERIGNVSCVSCSQLGDSLLEMERRGKRALLLLALDSRTFVGDDGKRLATEVRAWRRGGLNTGTLPENSRALESALRAVDRLHRPTTATTRAVAAFKRKAMGGSAAAAEASAEPSVSVGLRSFQMRKSMTRQLGSFRKNVFAGVQPASGSAGPKKLPVLLVHCVEQDREHGGCAFAEVIENTPSDLLRTDKLYASIALPWYYDRDFRETSLAVLSHELAKTDAQSLSWLSEIHEEQSTAHL